MPGKGGQMVRAAPVLVLRWWLRKAITSPSSCRLTEVRMVRKECYATIGQVGNADIRNVSLGKAGRKRWMGRRPRSSRQCDEPL